MRGRGQIGTDLVLLASLGCVAKIRLQAARRFYNKCGLSDEYNPPEPVIMDKLWAPWRLSYVAAPKPPTGDEPCFICQGLADNDDRRNLIALRTLRSVVVLNRFPYNNGHLLVAPRAHRGTLADLDDADLLEIMRTVRQMAALLNELLHPDGHNIGLNLGRAAGAGLPGHLHWHIVPRWNGDTNFMPVLSDTKIISQSLDAFYDCLRERLT